MRRLALAAALALAPSLAWAQFATYGPTQPQNSASGNLLATLDYVKTAVSAVGQPSLAPGAIWIGSAASAATAQILSGDLTVSQSGVITLATVNSNVGSFGSSSQCVALTVNAKGLITAASAVTCAPAIGSITGVGTGGATWLGTPSSANLRAFLTDETGTGLAYFQGGDIGTPSAGVATNLTGTASGLTAGHVTTNANLTGDVTSSGNATTLANTAVTPGSYTSANVTVDSKGRITAAANGPGSNATFVNYLGGLTLSNDATTPNSVLDIAAGVAMDSTNASLVTIGAFTKSTAGAWAVGSGSNGMGNGVGLAANTWYHVCLTPNGGTSDIWFDVSAACVDKPTGVSGTLFRRIGSFKTDGSSHILAFIQRRGNFYWAQPVQDQTATALTAATPTSLTLASVPLGVRTRPIAVVNTQNTGTPARVRLYSPDLPDNNINNDMIAGIAAASATATSAYNEDSNNYVNTSQQIRAFTPDSNATVSIFTNGWIDDLGQ